MGADDFLGVVSTLKKDGAMNLKKAKEHMTSVQKNLETKIENMSQKMDEKVNRLENKIEDQVKELKSTVETKVAEIIQSSMKEHMRGINSSL